MTFDLGLTFHTDTRSYAFPEVVVGEISITARFGSLRREGRDYEPASVLLERIEKEREEKEKDRFSLTDNSLQDEKENRSEEQQNQRTALSITHSADPHSVPGVPGYFRSTE